MQLSDIVLSDAAARAICWTLLHSLWQGILVAALAVLVRQFCFPDFCRDDGLSAGDQGLAADRLADDRLSRGPAGAGQPCRQPEDGISIIFGA